MKATGLKDNSSVDPSTLSVPVQCICSRTSPLCAYQGRGIMGEQSRAEFQTTFEYISLYGIIIQNYIYSIIIQ